MKNSQTLVELPSIKETTEDYEALESYIKKIFKKEIYIPLISEFGGNSRVIKNSAETLLSAIQSGRIQFYRGVFSGEFNSEISKELKKLGATWDRSKKAWKLPSADLPLDVRMAISASASQFQRKLEKIDRILAAISPEELAGSMQMTRFFDSALWKVEKSLKKSMKNLVVQPELTKEQRQRIADEWQNNMKLWIHDFTEKEIKELRGKIQKTIFAGNRYESAIKTIQKSYQVSANKAKFLARQETMLLMTKFKETRYQDAGVNEYKWRCVKGTPLHPVRPMHKALNDRSEKGEIFRFDQPPVDDPKGGRHNPSQNYNCLPGNTVVSFDQPVLKIFKRRYTGKTAILVTDDNVVIETTGNHPILTNSGWRPANEVNLGDYLFKRVGESIDIKKMNGQYVEAGIEDIFSALSICSPIMVDRLSSSDFHGDVIEDKQVDIISPNRELILNGITELYEMFEEFLFKGTFSSRTRFSSFDKTTTTWGLASDSFIGFFNELTLFLQRHSPESKCISLRARSLLDPTKLKPSGNSTPFNSIFFSDGKFTHPKLVILNSVMINGCCIPGNESTDSFDRDSPFSKALAEQVGIDFKSASDFSNSALGASIKPLRIIDKSFRDFSGHVYNLQTGMNWYYANSLVMANCRCTAVPVVRFKK
jgi:SPP1 gp7 family putative phage head morphogenesis protein